jgi:hypothetical protein
MTSSETVRAAVYRTILRHEGEVFQSYRIREELGWSEKDPEGRRLHAIVQDLKKEGVIKQTGTQRKRNQYLMLDKPDELRLRLGRIRSRAPSTNGKARPEELANKPGPTRVRYLEERVDELEETIADLAEVKRVLKDMKIKVDDLHREWVTS